MGKKKRSKRKRIQAHKSTGASSTVVKSKLSVQTEPTRFEPASKPSLSAESSQVSQELQYVRGDIRRTTVLVGIIIVFYTIVYFVLQSPSNLSKLTQLLRLGS